MFGVIFNHLKEKVLHLNLSAIRVSTKTAKWHKSSLLSFLVTCVSLLFINQLDIFYIFCRTFGPAFWHFLSDIHKKCPIVRQVRRISTALSYCLLLSFITKIILCILPIRQEHFMYIVSHQIMAVISDLLEQNAAGILVSMPWFSMGGVHEYLIMSFSSISSFNVLVQVFLFFSCMHVFMIYLFQEMIWYSGSPTPAFFLRWLIRARVILLRRLI